MQARDFIAKQALFTKHHGLFASIENYVDQIFLAIWCTETEHLHNLLTLQCKRRKIDHRVKTNDF